MAHSNKLQIETMADAKDEIASMEPVAFISGDKSANNAADIPVKKDSGTEYFQRFLIEIKS